MGINLKEIGENAQNTDFKPLPDGRYNVIISAAELGKTKTGKDMITVTFDITEGKYTNRKLWSNFTLTDKAYVYIYALLKAINSDLIEDEDVEPEIIAGNLIGGKCSVMVTTEKNPTTNVDKNVVGGYKTLEEAGELAGLEDQKLFE